MNDRNGSRRNRGQALIITALIITLMLMSTVYYVLETENETISIQSTADSYFSVAKISTRNTVISALANVSNGGDTEALTTSLEELSSMLHAHSYDAEFDLSFTPLNATPYQDGTWISSGEDGSGVSSAYASFVINVLGSSENYSSTYETNVTTSLYVNGTYTVEGSEETVNVTCTVYDENGPTLANRIAIFYQNQTDESWLSVDQQNNLTTVDFGNGTYDISFSAYSQGPVNVSVQINDLRDIFVMANATCVQV
ncbi:MAG: hypothetical protein WCD81_05045 [Candidatus Bathyarchaeia archaeon]